jgi:hypothetical protein
MSTKSLPVALVLTSIVGSSAFFVSARPTLSGQTTAPKLAPEPLDAASLGELKGLYRTLINAENAHDLKAVRRIIWESPSTLFVAKTKTPAEGNWAGFWGSDVVMQHFHDLFQGPFRIDPDYAREKVVGLTRDVAETYVPVQITVAYAGQTPVPKPFLMILTWIRTPQGWRMATDIALPIPPAPAQEHP